MVLRSLCPELEEKAKSELNEDPKRIVNDLAHVKDWLLKQPHIQASTDDQWLLAFLRGCKYSSERTKERLDLHYAIRTIAPELFQIKHDDPVFDELLDVGSIVVSPNSASADSPRVIILRPALAEKVHVVHYFSVITTVLKILMLNDDNAVISGIQWIIDLQGASTTYIFQLTAPILKKMILHYQEATPLRVKGAYYINSLKIFETFFNIMTTFLNEKNKNRQVLFGENFEGLYEHIPKSILPVEYGGNAGTIKEISDTLKAKKKALSSWLEEESKHRTDESRRPGKPKTTANLFGIEGSFRQLELD